MIARQIVEAASVPNRPGLYCLGPFPRRVSFSAQQYRALNLVWALHEERALQDPAEVAVIGAGLAGLTAAAAFVGYGCKVDVYDQAATTMSRQRDTLHRLVHPSVNQWPEKELSHTTEFPFLEWYAGACNTIVENIAAQFDSLTGAKFFAKVEATDIVAVATDRLGLYVNPPRMPRPTYDLVLLAVGFGQEGGGEFPAIDYWSPDALEASRQNGSIQYIVSGCGDGGVIDALRLVHSNFRRGKLVFETAATLTGTPIAEEIKNAEKRAETKFDIRALAAAYERCADLLDAEPRYRDVARSLNESYWQNATLVYLVDRTHEQPYSLRAAPIHKLLLAHAIRRGEVDYYMGQVTSESGQIHAANRSFDPRHCKVITRHGAEARFGRLLGNDQIQQVRDKQKGLADHYATKLWTGCFPVPQGYPLHDPSRQEFANHRHNLAARAIHEIAADANIALTKNGYKVIFANRIPPNAPAHLFGIPVRTEIIRQIGIV